MTKVRTGKLVYGIKNLSELEIDGNKAMGSYTFTGDTWELLTGEEVIKQILENWKCVIIPKKVKVKNMTSGELAERANQLVGLEV